MDMVSVTDALQQGLNHCNLVLSRDGDILAALFGAGLAGGVSHCTGMCGPFVLTQVAARLEQIPLAALSEWRRLSGAALVPYHLGRATAYAGIGAAAAAVAGHVGALGDLRGLSALLLAFAAVFFLSYALKGLGLGLGLGLRLGLAVGWPGRRSETASAPGLWSRTVSRLARPLFAAPVGWRGYGLGVALGFIPCGLVYGAVAVAAASGDGIAGAMGMLAFVAGTVPALLAVGVAGHLAGRQWRAAVARVAPLIMMINAGVLGWMAVRMLVA